MTDPIPAKLAERMLNEALTEVRDLGARGFITRSDYETTYQVVATTFAAKMARAYLDGQRELREQLIKQIREST